MTIQAEAQRLDDRRFHFQPFHMDRGQRPEAAIDTLAAAVRTAKRLAVIRHLDGSRRVSVRAGNRRVGGLGIDPSPWIWMLVGLASDAANFFKTSAKTAAAASAASASWLADRHRRVARAPGGYVKRILDIAIASTAIVLLAPLLVVVALLVRRSMGGPVIFSHPRIGQDGREFDCYKFRSMVVNGNEILKRHLENNPAAAAEWERTRKLRDDPRILPLGHMLRKTSIDELPQLWNVLKGDMSCVGPRPIVRAELEKYGIHARHYLRTRPGLTGLWQISGRSSSSYRRRVVLDTKYVRGYSFLIDLWILVRTIPAVIKTGDAA